jgi:hypothetical protein
MQRRKRDERLSQTLPSQRREDEDPAAVEGGLGGLLFDEDQERQHPVRVESSTFQESRTLRQTLSPAKALTVTLTLTLTLNVTQTLTLTLPSAPP